MKDPLKSLVQLAITAGLYRADAKAREAVTAVVQARDEAARNSEDGKRLATVRSRIRKTNEQLIAAKSGLEQAEANHFTALSGDSDGAIESARAEVLSHQSKIGLLQTEVESLKTIEAEARAAFGGYVEQQLPVLFRDARAEAQAKQTDAVNAIMAVFEANGVHQLLKNLAEATESLEIIGGDAHALRIACTDLGMSELFGRLLPPNHVSLKEFDKLSPAQMQGARVRV